MSSAELLIEAIDTATALYDALMQWLIVLATVAAILVIAAVACGAWGIRAVMEALSARETAEVPESGARLLRAPERPAEGRVGLRSARVPRSGPTATAPSRPHSPRWSASQGPGGGFHAPTPASRSPKRSAPSWANTQPINEEAA